jgi:hypothetical protein
MTRMLTGVGAIAVIFAATAVSAGAAGVVESVTGSSKIHIVGTGPCAGQFATRSLTVRKYEDGTVDGQSQVHVMREQGSGPDVCDGDLYHAELNCLQVFGNVAIASGPITRTNDAAAEFLGRTIVLALQDNGEGANDEADRLVRVPPLPFGPYPATATCMSFSLAAIQAALLAPGTGYEVEAGNVQIHGGA